MGVGVVTYFLKKVVNMVKYIGLSRNSFRQYYKIIAHGIAGERRGSNLPGRCIYALDKKYIYLKYENREDVLYSLSGACI